LLDAVCAAQEHFAELGSLLANDPVPGEGWFELFQGPGGLAGAAGEAGEFGDRAVGGYLAEGDAADDSSHLLKHASPRSHGEYEPYGCAEPFLGANAC